MAFDPLAQTAAPVIANGANMTNAFWIREARTGLLTLPAAMTATSVKFQTSTALDGTFATLKDSAGSDVSVSIANGACVQIPAAVFSGAAALKIVGNANEAAARTLTVQMKS